MSEQTLTGYLGPEFQLKVLWKLVTEIDFAEKTLPLLHIDYFDDITYKKFYNVINQYNETYKKPCNIQNKTLSLAIKKFAKKNDPIEQETLVATAKQINDWNQHVLNKDIPHDGDVVERETVNFIKQQEYRKVADFIQHGAQKGDNSDEFLVDIEEQLKHISDIGSEDDMGTEVMDDISDVLSSDFRRTIPTGIPAIDALTRGGLGNGEIGIVLGPSGFGKTTILSKFANTAYNLGYNVFQVIFEDTPKQIKRKHYAIWSKVPLSEFDNENDKIDDQRRKSEIREKITEWHNKNDFGQLIIKRFSQDSTTIPKIRQFIDRYQKKTGTKFDLIVLDYLDCVEPHKKVNDELAGELAIIKSFESMANEMDIPCWSALQTNRSGFNAEKVSHENAGGNIKRVQKTHFLMSIAKTDEQKEAGLANIAILKARMAKDGQFFNDCIFNNDTIEITIDDSFSANTRKNLEKEKVTEEMVESFNSNFVSINKNQNEIAGEMIIPEESINQNPSEINNNQTQTGTINNMSPDFIKNTLAQMGDNQNIMKKD